MIAGIVLAFVALATRGITVNRYVRSRLLISAILFGAYAFAAAVVLYAPVAVGVGDQLRTLTALLLAVGTANAIVVLAINPWRVDRIPEHFPHIVQDAIVIALVGLAAMLFLPDKVVATTAVGAVVIGFALQDTLGNLFAGLAIQVEKPFRVGHWVTIGGKDGLVSEITWRATKIRTKAGNFVVVPNSVLSRDTITNYSEPTRETRLDVQVTAGYDAAPNEVRQVIEAALAGEPLILADPLPEVQLAEFGDSSIVYRVRVWTTEFARDEAVRERVRTRVYYAFRRSGIAFPFPVRVLARVPRREHEQADESLAHGLDSVEIFASLTPAQRSHLASRARIVTYAAGEVIAREGEPGASMFVLRSGKASVTVENTVGELARLDPGAFFGEMSLLTGDRRIATVTALTDCTLLEVAVEAFRDVVLTDAVGLDRVAAAVTSRRAEIERHRATRATTAPEEETPQTFLERVRKFLIS
jgi:small-conductance mechanosensitive channel/CRP-like cAMP-binding protein